MKFINEVLSEMQFVKWPTRRAVIASSIAVLVISIFMSAFLGGVDFGLREALAKLLVK